MKFNKVSTKDFYPILEYWWERHHFTAVSRGILPPEVFVVSKGETPIYSMFLYETNSGLCWIAWPLSNPDVSKTEKEGGLDFLIKKVSEYAKEKGFIVSFTTSPVRPVQESLKREGYQEGDVKVNHYLKILF